MFVLFNPVEYYDYNANGNVNRDVYDNMNEWRNGTNANNCPYTYRHYLNWNKTEHVDYNQVPGGAGAAAGLLRNAAG